MTYWNQLGIIKNVTDQKPNKSAEKMRHPKRTQYHTMHVTIDCTCQTISQCGIGTRTGGYMSSCPYCSQLSYQSMHLPRVKKQSTTCFSDFFKFLNVVILIPPTAYVCHEGNFGYTAWWHYAATRLATTTPAHSLWRKRFDQLNPPRCYPFEELSAGTASRQEIDHLA